MDSEMSERSPVSTLISTENTCIVRFRKKGRKEVGSMPATDAGTGYALHALCDYHVFEGTFIPVR